MSHSEKHWAKKQALNHIEILLFPFKKAENLYLFVQYEIYIHTSSTPHFVHPLQFLPKTFSMHFVIRNMNLISTNASHIHLDKFNDCYFNRNHKIKKNENCIEIIRQTIQHVNNTKINVFIATDKVEVCEENAQRLKYMCVCRVHAPCNGTTCTLFMWGNVETLTTSFN